MAKDTIKKVEADFPGIKVSFYMRKGVREYTASRNGTNTRMHLHTLAEVRAHLTSGYAFSR